MAIGGAARTGKSALLARLCGRVPDPPARYAPTEQVQSHVITLRSSAVAGGEAAAGASSSGGAVLTCVQLLEVPAHDAGARVDPKKAGRGPRIPPELARDATYASCDAVVMLCDPREPTSVSFASGELSRMSASARCYLIASMRDAWPQADAGALAARARTAAEGADSTRGALHATVVLEVSAGDCFGLKGVHAALRVHAEEQRRRRAEEEARAASERAARARAELDECVVAVYVPRTRHATASPASASPPLAPPPEHAIAARTRGLGSSPERDLAGTFVDHKAAIRAGSQPVGALAAAAAAAIALGDDADAKAAVAGFYSDSEGDDTVPAAAAAAAAAAAPAAGSAASGEGADADARPAAPQTNRGDPKEPMTDGEETGEAAAGGGTGGRAEDGAVDAGDAGTPPAAEGPFHAGAASSDRETEEAAGAGPEGSEAGARVDVAAMLAAGVADMEAAIAAGPPASPTSPRRDKRDRRRRGSHRPRKSAEEATPEERRQRKERRERRRRERDAGAAQGSGAAGAQMHSPPEGYSCDF